MCCLPPLPLNSDHWNKDWGCSLFWIRQVRGKGGGYRLSRSPEEYNVKSILELMEGPLAPVACLESGRNACPRKNTFDLKKRWRCAACRHFL